MDDLELLILLCWDKSGTSPLPALKAYFENFYCIEKLKWEDNSSYHSLSPLPDRDTRIQGHLADREPDSHI